MDAPRDGRIHRTALVLVLSMHATAVFLLGASTGQAKQQDRPPEVFKVSLLPMEGRAAQAQAGQPAEEARSAGEPDPGQAPGRSEMRENSGPVTITQPSGPHYFRLRELTQPPELLRDAAADLVLRIPGLPPQPVILRLLISDEGNVDRVVIEDSYLAKDVERQVTEAFSNMKFSPGRIGRVAVRSQMRVEARLETMERRTPGTPPPA